MKKFLLIAAAVVMMTTPVMAEVKCNQDGCKSGERTLIPQSADVMLLIQEGTYVEDRSLAAKAIDSVVEYFQSIGYNVDTDELDFTIIFNDSVVADSTGTREVSGYYNAKTREINVFSFSVDRANRIPWGLPWSKDIAYSILQHEIAHALMYHVRAGLPKTGRVWSEYVAYGIQFAVMNPELREQILNGPKKTDGYIHSPLMVNMMTYGADADRFSIMAHNTIERGLFLIRDTLDNPPPETSLDF